MPIFDLTKEDIAELDDKQLRELVGRLSVAELSSSSDPTSSVRWGGHHNAPDGGLDIEILLENSPKKPDFVKRQHTGFQAKKESSGFSASKIIKEMKPEGKLRPIIIQLIKESGSYVIVSNADDCSSSEQMLPSRLNAMKEAIKNEKHSENLHTDFYDKNHLATWVRNYPSIILWVKQTIGKAFTGWQPFGNWSDSPEGEDDVYLISNDVCIHDDSNQQHRDLHISEGIRKLRETINVKGTSTRLVGLSGVGKTRLVQALFEGEYSLEKSLAVYVDLGLEPEPSAQNMAENLMAQGKRIILVIDNCRPIIHRELTKVITKEGSKVSLLTVEYDINDDEKEETKVFHLEPASLDLIKTLVLRRDDSIGSLNAEKIAEFSGGNARIAIALAKTIKRGQSLGNLTEENLFERLFYQRKDKDQNLLVRAEVLSLVYSYDGENTQESNTELAVLASLMDEKANDLYKCSTELFRRKLVQKRSKWRAVLPHAIANRLAKRALENTPQDLLIDTFCAEGNKRLLKSFTHRLSYLHDSEEAQTIVDLWLSKGGMLGDVEKFDDFHILLFSNLAPVSPEKALEAIERASNGGKQMGFCSKHNLYFEDFTSLLFLLAYEKKLFERAARVLVKFVKSGFQDNIILTAKDDLRDLFKFQLEDAAIRPDPRATIIDELIKSDELEVQNIGYELLNISLNADYFRFPRDLGFGARSRDVTYSSKNIADRKLWHSNFFNLANGYLDSINTEQTTQILKIFADAFYGLWVTAQMHNEMEELATKIRSRGIWIEGWCKIRNLLSFDLDDEQIEKRDSLEQIFKNLKPITVEEKVHFFVFGKSHDLSYVYSDDDYELADTNYSSEVIYKNVKELSKEIASNIQKYSSILSDLVVIGEEFDHRFQFSEELAKQTKDKTKLWNLLVCDIKKLPIERRSIQTLRGFLCGAWEVSHELVNKWLDSVVLDQKLRPILVNLQTVIDIDSLGYKRLMKALDYEDTPVQQFKLLHNSWIDDIPFFDDDYAGLLIKLLRKENGAVVALSLFSARFPERAGVVYEASEKLLNAGRKIFMFVGLKDERKESIDRSMSRLVSYCICENVSDHVVRGLYQNFMGKLDASTTPAFQFPQVMWMMAKQRPQVFLDVFLLCPDLSPQMQSWMFSWRERRHWNKASPLAGIDSSDILKWCSHDPKDRFLKVAYAIHLYDERGLTDTAIAILENSPSPCKLLEIYKELCEPGAWSGPLSETIRKGRLALEVLIDHENLEIVTKAHEVVNELLKDEEDQRKFEELRVKAKEQRFE